MDNNQTEEYEKEHCTPSEKWKEFLENTTLHGIRNVVPTRKPFMRMLWSILLLAFGIYYFVTVYRAVDKYFQYPATTKINRKYMKNMTFPEVSICPNNYFSKAKIMMQDDDPEFATQGLNLSACAATKDLRQKEMNNMACGLAMVCCCANIGYEYGATVISNCTEKRRNDLRRALQKSGVYFNMEDFFRYYSQDLNEVFAYFQFCIFGWNQGCTAADFLPVITEYGLCYTFNSGKNNERLKIVNISGISSGLQVVLNINYTDHIIGKFSQGFSVSIHTQGEFFAVLDGFSASPGMRASIGLIEQRVCFAIL